jgi:hypothetical protein
MPDRDLADEIVRCARRTLSAGSARIAVTYDLDFSWPEERRTRRRRGGLLRPVGRALKAAGKAGWNAFLRSHDFRHQTGEGVIEPRERRHMLDYGGWAEMFRDGTWWSGPSGAPLSHFHPEPNQQRVDAWWLLDALLGTTGAEQVGEEEVGGTTCRKLQATVDMSRASEAAPAGLRVPRVSHFGNLLELPIEVWIDDAHVRRLRFREGAEHAETTTMVELRDFGEPDARLDWSRLPRFRSAG